MIYNNSNDNRDVNNDDYKENELTVCTWRHSNISKQMELVSAWIGNHRNGA